MNYAPYNNFVLQSREYERTHTKLTSDRLYILDSLSDQCQAIAGVFAECGVWLGGSAKVLLKNKPLYLFDTFSGMPENNDPSNLPGGSFGNTSIESVKDYLGYSSMINYRKGRIPESFSGLENLKFSFVHIDVDLYESTKECLNYFLPRMTPGGIMVFDDYGFPDYEHSERKAVDEKIKVTAIPTGQAIYIHR